MAEIVGRKAVCGNGRRARASLVGALAVGMVSGLALLPGMATAPSTNGLADLSRTPAPLGLAGRTAPLVATLGERLTGQQVRTGPVVNTAFSANWSGLGGTGRGIQGAQGSWIVPTAAASPSGRFSSSWVGVDGITNHNLIQTGTEQDSAHNYFAWWEILPQQEVRIVTASGRPATVRPGDHIVAAVEQASAGVWTIAIEDITQDWTYAANHAYSGPGTSAEWIEEAPTVNGVQSTPPAFGTVHFSGTAVAENLGSGQAWYSTKMGAANEIVMINPAGTKILAMPSAPSKPSSTGQGFADTHVSAPVAPVRVRGQAKVHAIKLSWKAPTRTGGTAIVSYKVREYRGGALRRTFTVKATSTTVKGLLSGDRYSFSVAAHSKGNYTSGWSARSGIVRPKG